MCFHITEIEGSVCLFKEGWPAGKHGSDESVLNERGGDQGSKGGQLIFLQHQMKKRHVKYKYIQYNTGLS